MGRACEHWWKSREAAGEAAAGPRSWVPSTEAQRPPVSFKWTAGGSLLSVPGGGQGALCPGVR